jgi:uncharacterized protein (DUF433 family)
MVMITNGSARTDTQPSLKEAAVLSGVTVKVIRHELAAHVVRASRSSAGTRRFRPRELLYFCLVAELPIELLKKDRRDLFDLLSAGAERRRRWRREKHRLVLEGGVPVVLPIDDLLARVDARVALYLRGRDRVASRPDVLSGEPIFSGTRIAVRFVGGRAQKEPVELLLEDYPALGRDDVEFAKMYVALGRPPGRPRRLRLVRGEG